MGLQRTKPKSKGVNSRERECGVIDARRTWEHYHLMAPSQPDLGLIDQSQMYPRHASMGCSIAMGASGGLTRAAPGQVLGTLQSRPDWTISVMSAQRRLRVVEVPPRAGVFHGRRGAVQVQRVKWHDGVVVFHRLATLQGHHHQLPHVELVHRRLVFARARMGTKTKGKRATSKLPRKKSRRR